MTVDNYQESVLRPTTTSRAPFTITPHDTDPLPVVPKALYVGAGGNITLRGVDSGADVLFANVPDGSYLLVQPSYVRATGTTASAIVGL